VEVKNVWSLTCNPTIRLHGVALRIGFTLTNIPHYHFKTCATRTAHIAVLCTF